MLRNVLVKEFPLTGDLKSGSVVRIIIISFHGLLTAFNVLRITLFLIFLLGLQCPRGQMYDTCGKACSRSCEDISRQKKCSQLCIEGCNCPSGFTLDQRGVCIPISKCPCTLNGLQYPPGHAEIRPASKGLDLW